MNRPMMKCRPSPWLLLFVLVASNISSATACGNSPALKVIVNINGVRRKVTCSKVGRNKSKYCKRFDKRSGKVVKKVCQDQCLSKCQGGGGVEIDPIPPGPYISSTTNSKVITLPNPPPPSLVTGTARTNCPHLKTGLKSWHSASTWPNGVVPSKAGSYVTLPKNTKVLVSRSITQKLGIITIPASSELIIGEATGGISMLVKGIDVQGKLTAGSESCRIETPITITLWSSRPSNAVQTIPDPKTKGIVVSGNLSLHGRRYYSTWSRLARTIQAGETVLLLQRPVNWERGQKVVLTTSLIYDSRAYHQNEIVTVYKVEAAADTPSGVGAVVHLTAPVKYKHVANQYYQVEAGLLSRTIVVQGSPSDSEPTDMDPLNCRTKGFQSYDFYYNLPAPCTTKEKTGYGGHIMVGGTGTAQVEGIELFRMGQTNVLGRYPIHFHMLKNCPSCYFRDSSVHRSYYRCISVHGTSQMTVSENVAYDVIGYCYYLEDGVEQYNTISYNLAAHIHMLGPNIPTDQGQLLNDYVQSAVAGSELTLPADVTASGFYITNVHNYLIGNAASGGYSGFAFPNLDTPLGLNKNVKLRPASASGLKIDGNTAHSTGFWWKHASGYYFGASFYYKSDGLLRYNPGRAMYGRGARWPCSKWTDCAGTSSTCREENQIPINMTNTKSFLTAGVSFNSWNGLMNLMGYESYDARLSFQALSKGFWLTNAYFGCRSGEALPLPWPGSIAKMEGSGLVWYDTTQSHILTDIEFENCGVRSSNYTQYGSSSTRGCGNSTDNLRGCDDDSSVFGFASQSDEMVPEVMQATKKLKFTDCGRRFRFSYTNFDTVSSMMQNWLDVDGTASGLNVPTIIGSGIESVKDWWGVDDDAFYDEQGPLYFIKKNNGPNRGIGSITLIWDKSLEAKVGSSLCVNNNGKTKPYCPIQGYLRHAGYRFSPAQSSASKGLSVSANADITGPVGGYGWILKLNNGAPRDLNITDIEVAPGDTMMLSIAYPVGTVFSISANAESWCIPRAGSISCREDFTAASSVDQVRTGAGNKYYVDSKGILTMRIFQLARIWTGDPDWLGIPSWSMMASDGVTYAVPRFDRDGIKMPNYAGGYFRIKASSCGGSGLFCTGSVNDYDPNVCPSGYKQVAYDKCCSTSSPSTCTYASS